MKKVLKFNKETNSMSLKTTLVIATFLTTISPTVKAVRVSIEPLLAIKSQGKIQCKSRAIVRFD